MRSNETINRGNSFDHEINPRRSFTANDIGRFLDGLGGLFSPSRTGGQKPDETPSEPEQNQIIVSPPMILESVGDFENLESLLGDQPEEQVNTWREAAREKVDYPRGRRRVVAQDGKTRYVTYEPGTALYIKKDKEERELIMDTFEDKWCEETSRMALEGIELNEKEPLVMVERGYGLGRIFDMNIVRLVKTATQLADNGQNTPIEYTVIELNQQIHNEDAKPRIDEVNGLIKRFNETRDRLGQNPIKLEIKLLLGDADKVLEQEFLPQSVDVIISDTHQLDPSKRGINDILKPDLLTSRLKKMKGRLLICAFHKRNQTGSIDPNQAVILGQKFREIIIRRVKATVPPHVAYYDTAEVEMPVVLCKNPII